MTAYVGSGPYCYTNSLTMVLGEPALPSAVVETLTGSPFGLQLLAGELPMFDPYGWDPEIGVDDALELLGWSCERSGGGSREQALNRLRAACVQGPVMAGPLEMGLLAHQPGSGAALGADHYVTVLAVDADEVLFHDPHGHPYATLPTAAFSESWRADTIAYVDEPYIMRHTFTRQRRVAAHQALRRALPRAIRWLAGRDELSTPPGTLGAGEAATALAAQAEQGLDPRTRQVLSTFAVRVGARRLNDAGVCLGGIGLPDAAAVAAEQSRIVGSLQHLLVAEDDRAVGAKLRDLAPTYERLRAALAPATVSGAE